MGLAGSTEHFRVPAKWAPPTVTWAVLLAALAGFGDLDWSHPIERSALPGSPNERSKLVRSLRALELIGEDHAPTLQLRRLVREPDRREFLCELLIRFYPEPWSWVMEEECSHQRLDAWLLDHGAEPYEISNARAFFKNAVVAAGQSPRYRRNPRRVAHHQELAPSPQAPSAGAHTGSIGEDLERQYLERLIELASEKEREGLEATDLWNRVERRLDLIRGSSDLTKG